MAKYSSIHHRATLLGDMFGGTEIWSTSFSLAQSNGGDEGEAPTEAEAQAIAEAFAPFWSNVSNGANQYYRFTGVKVSHVSTDGTSDSGLTRFYTFPTAIAGPANFSTPHPQLSVAVTLATLKARGKGSKGRMFLPGLTASIDGTGKLATAQCTQIANGFKTFLDAVNASTAVPGFVHLMSAEKAGVPYSAPQQNRVASVRVGNVVDTQRRRRNQLVEQYQSAVLA